MTKELVTTAQNDNEEGVVRTSPEPKRSMSSSNMDTRTVVVAVGASVVLFAIGLILGYLLGHQTGESSRGGLDGRMMNGDTRNYQYRTR